MRRIVVGYDGSPSSRGAVAYATAAAGRAGLVVVVHAFGPPATPGSHHPFQDAIEEHRRSGEELLEALAREPDGPLAGAEHELVLIGGTPAEQLVEAARRHSAEQIVVGSRGASPLMAALGSVSHELLYIADRPVVVIPPAPGSDPEQTTDEPGSRAAKETVR